ncbi:putative Acid phosphatase [Helianthus annuus]|nr:putative Acid phosphatase [Helianthus annuus]
MFSDKQVTPKKKKKKKKKKSSTLIHMKGLGGDNYQGNAVEYKSGKRKELEEAGYRIRGNMGDQWSDLIGSNTGDRTFKVPDPMYYIG